MNYKTTVSIQLENSFFFRGSLIEQKDSSENFWLKIINQLSSLSILISLLVLSTFNQPLQAQCTVHNRDGGVSNNVTCGGSGIVGQTFTACQDGEVTSVSVTHATMFCTPQAGEYRLYMAVDPGSGMAIPTNSPVATVSVGVAPSDGQVLTFNLSTPFPVINDGTLYRFVILNSGGDMNFRADSDDYAGGTFINTNSNYSAGVDLDFELQIIPGPPPPPGQCVVNGLDAGDECSCSGTGIAGSTFTPCATGLIYYVLVRHSHLFAMGEAGLHELYIAKEPGSGTPIPEDPVASVNLTSPPESGEIMEFHIPQGFRVDEGMVYRFTVKNTEGEMNLLAVQAPGDYPGGGFVGTNSNVSDPATGSDLDFEIVMYEVSFIPTMSQWGLIMLCITLLIIGMVALKSKIPELKF